MSVNGGGSAVDADSETAGSRDGAVNHAVFAAVTVHGHSFYARLGVLTVMAAIVMQSYASFREPAGTATMAFVPAESVVIRVVIWSCGHENGDDVLVQCTNKRDCRCSTQRPEPRQYSQPAADGEGQWPVLRKQGHCT